MFCSPILTKGQGSKEPCPLAFVAKKLLSTQLSPSMVEVLWHMVYNMSYCFDSMRHLPRRRRDINYTLQAVPLPAITP